CRIDNRQNLIPLAFGIDIQRDNRSKKLFTHRPIVWPPCLDQGGSDEVSDRIIGLTAGDHLRTVGALRFLYVSGELLECRSIYDSPHEIPEIGNVANGERICGLDQLIFDPLPHTVRNVNARGSTALLPLILETAANDPCDQRIRLSTCMGENEVLATGFSDKSWIGLVLRDVLTDGTPHLLENGGRTGEMNSGKVGMV